MSNYQAYGEIEATSDVMSATPHRLIQLLLEKCLQQIEIAKHGIEKKDVTLKIRAVLRANDIIEYLQLCLDRNTGQTEKLVKQLDELYYFVRESLGLANKYNAAVHLEHAKTVLRNIKEGWDGIAHLVGNK